MFATAHETGLVCALALVLTGMSATTLHAEADDARNVILITIDTLRADALGFMGNDAVETPVLDQLAAKGRVFTNAHAHNVVTLPSHANMLTGLYPYQHGVRDNSGFRLPDHVPTLATRLKAKGFATAAFVAAYPLDALYGLGRGFDVYDDELPTGLGNDTFALAERRGDEVVARARAWWGANTGQRRFLWLHLFDPHAPYAPPEPFASRYAKNPYLGEVAAVDAFLAPFLRPFLDGREQPTLIAVTADHGEALGEHGEKTHGLFAYETTLKIPLVLWGPGVASGRDDRSARHVDLVPTVLQGLGVAPAKADAELPGRSLLQPAEAGTASYFEALSATLNRGWAPLRGVLQDGGKVIALPLPELYDLPSDPGETRNRIDDQRRRARALLAQLPEESTWPPARTAGGEDVEALRALGYVASSAPSRKRYGPEDDPKNLIALDTKIHTIIDRYVTGDVDGSVTLAREVVQARPSMPLGHALLAQALLETGAKTEALDVMQKARADGFASDSMLRQLGLTLAELGRGDEAIDVLEPLAEASDDPETLNVLALAYSEAGKQPEAGVTLQRVLALDADNPTALEYLSLVFLRLGRWPEAAAHASRAVARNPRLHQAWNNLGVARFQSGDAGAALDAWAKAIEIEPELWDALFNLGTKAAELGRDAQASAALRRFVDQAPDARYRDDKRAARALLGKLGGGP